jgi:hypothetical protein
MVFGTIHVDFDGFLVELAFTVAGGLLTACTDIMVPHCLERVGMLGLCAIFDIRPWLVYERFIRLRRVYADFCFCCKYTQVNSKLGRQDASKPRESPIASSFVLITYELAIDDSRELSRVLATKF